MAAIIAPALGAGGSIRRSARRSVVSGATARRPPEKKIEETVSELLSLAGGGEGDELERDDPGRNLWGARITSDEEDLDRYEVEDPPDGRDAYGIRVPGLDRLDD